MPRREPHLDALRADTPLLGLSVRTVENHRANLMGKLGLVSRVELGSYAEEHDLL